MYLQNYNASSTTNSDNILR